ncbi:antibiotic biosynthesis monooxygenase family protein [Sunxiuqinia elliptica]|uniref:Heme-degrading monooxygenase HmoA n=1 Tax=Sunxiuqinia elliptica TaxID=655355 RepID=A0A1I2JF45_9BACT|nr:antibiotic biosynthesis monooxygenase [Sunxiuqinia elliptica]SFF52909.1 Heme-degrading monooxygenase HmoA [Sunxiuqinia elliptica]
MIAKTPQPPYYSVIFTSVRTALEPTEYGQMAQKMEEIAKLQPGYLGIESARNDLGITVSYWDSEEAIRNWKAQLEHRLAQKMGKERWYQSYKVRVARVERDYDFGVKS